MTVETYRFQVENLHGMVINDGYISNIPKQGFFPHAPADQLTQELHRHNIFSETLSVPCNCLVVDTGRHRVLLETGGGAGHPPYGCYLPDTPRLQANLGRLMAGLDAEGITPDSIDVIILSHAHTDHISGNADDLGKPFFRNADYFMPRGEWEGFTSLLIPDDDEAWNSWAGVNRFAQQQCLAIQDRIHLVDPEAEIIPGVRLIATPGHTPHHCSIEFKAGGERLVCPIDTTWIIAIEHPEWVTEDIRESQRQILARAGSSAMVHGFHFPFPGLGCLIPDGDGWRWQAI
jgi:glyoxylase-like metal-dependent hydrolase (beta-lactamase superfamily II)